MGSEVVDQNSIPEPPRRARSREGRHSSIRSGRTIGERRDHIETANERSAARRKVKKHKTLRFAFTVIVFALFMAAGIYFFNSIIRNDSAYQPTITVSVYAPTIEVIDEHTGSSDTALSSAMKEYIGKAEIDFRELGYTPTKAVRPVGSIREVDFYLDGYPGYIKLTTDRGTGVSTEDADRMLRYLKEKGITEFTYIDVRVDRKAYWK